MNAVGVDVNTASPPLLERVSGLNHAVAQSIVAYRDDKGRFASRAALREVPRLGEKAFEQAAGFLRIMNGDNPLDASAVHPESYPAVEKILADLKQDIKHVIGNGKVLKTLDPAKYADEKYGIPTITDILGELEKPGRDPRPEFTTATFKEGVNELKDLRPDMILEGVVTNVAAFGAFVDIGVHQDGLVHISALADTFVKDPHTVVKVGQVVKVKVVEIDEKRKRIALTMRMAEAVAQSTSGAQGGQRNRKPDQNRKPEQSGSRKEQRSEQATRPQQKPQQQKQKQKGEPKPDTAMAAAFAKLKGR